MNRFPWPLLWLLIGMICPYQAWSGELSNKGTLSLVLENDLFYNLDRHYTNGIRVIWIPDRSVPTPGWAIKLVRLLPWLPEQGKIRHGYAIGQSMYTPSDITITNPSLQDRPYAGWLYGTIAVGVESGRQLDQLEISVGVVGPASLAKQSQKFVHKIVGSNEPQGWGTQLKNEPGVVVNYQHSWRGIANTTLSGNRMDFTPHVGTVLGNVFTYADMGITVRYGERLPADYGPPRIQPGMSGPGDFSPTSNFGWYIFAGVEGRAVARNIFLDGNTFRDSRSVKKKPLIGDLQFGFVIDWSNMRFSYTHVLRTPEFYTQNNRDDFGAFSVSWKL